MFDKLKEKLKSWAKSLVKKAEPVEEKIESAEKAAEAPKEAIEKEEIEKTEIISEILEKPEEKIPPIEEHKYKEAEKREEIPEEREIGEKVWKDIEHEKETKEKKSFFQKIFSRITKVKISEEDFGVYAENLETLLLENNVAFEVAEKIINNLKKGIIEKEILKKEIENEIKKVFKKTIQEILIEPFGLAEEIKKFRKENHLKPYIILFCGINGTGKTTTVAKVAYLLKSEGLNCILVAGDTFRAASIEQLQEHGKKLGIEVTANKYGSDPASVGFDAIRHAEKKHTDCVLIDSAGRMHTAKNLMAEIEKISKVCKPDLKIFVGESITGNDATEQAKSFNSAVGIDGIILAKADIDEKGGTALSVGYITKKPILFLGTGQDYKDLEKFDKEKFIGKLGLGE